MESLATALIRIRHFDIWTSFPSCRLGKELSDDARSVLSTPPRERRTNESATRGDHHGKRCVHKDRGIGGHGSVLVQRA